MWNRFLPHESALSKQVHDWIDSFTKFTHRFLLGANPDVTSALKNGQNLMYTGKVYVGSQKQALSLIFDTGSDWLVVEDQACTNCVSKRFNRSLSTTFQINSTASMQLKYGSASLTGFTGNDTVGLDAAQNTANVDFMFYLANS